MTPEQIAHNQSIPGWFTTRDMRALSSLASTIVGGTIIELGSLHGRSSYCLSVSSPTSSIYCIDYWGEAPCTASDGVTRSNTISIFKSNTAQCENITPVQISHWRELTPEEIKWQEPVDMVFIDTSHTNPDDWKVISHWLPRIKKGGILCGHDLYDKEVHPDAYYPDVEENVKRLESMLGKPVTKYTPSCVWSFVV